MLTALVLMLCSTLVVGVLLWRGLFIQRRVWRARQVQIQDHLATVDLDTWLTTVATALAGGQSCREWDQVQSEPYPTFWHMNAPRGTWLGVLLVWCGLQGVGWVGVTCYHDLHTARPASPPSHGIAPVPGGPAESGDITDIGTCAAHDCFATFQTGTLTEREKRWNATVPLLTTELTALAGRAWSAVGPRTALVLPADAPPWCRLTAVLYWQDNRAHAGTISVYLLRGVHDTYEAIPRVSPRVADMIKPVQEGEPSISLAHVLPCPRGDFKAVLHNDTGQALAATPASVLTLQAVALGKGEPQ